AGTALALDGALGGLATRGQGTTPASSRRSSPSRGDREPAALPGGVPGARPDGLEELPLRPVPALRRRVGAPHGYRAPLSHRPGAVRAGAGSWASKLAWYRANGVLPAEEGGGPTGTPRRLGCSPSRRLSRVHSTKGCDQAKPLTPLARRDRFAPRWADC